MDGQNAKEKVLFLYVGITQELFYSSYTHANVSLLSAVHVFQWLSHL